MYNIIQVKSKKKGDYDFSKYEIITDDLNEQYKEILQQFRAYQSGKIEDVKNMCRQLNLSEQEMKRATEATREYYEPLSNLDVKLKEAKERSEETDIIKHDIFILSETLVDESDSTQSVQFL